jgi:acetyl esterase/lipase
MTSRTFIRSALILLLCGLRGYSSGKEGFTPDKAVVYKKVGHSELKLYIFSPPGHRAADKSSAIVFFFGGGWSSGSPSQFYPHCAYFASRGMVAMSAEYRVKNRDETSPAECVKDGKSAIRWIRRHADELGIDPDKLAAGGGSAGGQVAAATGTVQGFDEEGEDRSTSCRPNALVLFNPVFDNGPGGYGYDQVKDYWRDFSPMENIDTNTPPAVVFLGTKDALVPTATAEEFRKRMTANGVRCDLHLYPGQSHGFFNYAHREYFTATVTEADRFLVSIGFLKGEPTLPSGPNPGDGK